MTEDQEHHNWLTEITTEFPHSIAVVAQATLVWEGIKSLFGVQTQVPIAAYNTELNRISYYWTSDRFVFEIEVTEQSTEWFFRDRVTGRYKGDEY